MLHTVFPQVIKQAMHCWKLILQDLLDTLVILALLVITSSLFKEPTKTLTCRAWCKFATIITFLVHSIVSVFSATNGNSALKCKAHEVMITTPLQLSLTAEIST